MTKPVPPVGTKRICSACAAKFYDLDKRPVVCPKCAAEQTGSTAIVS
ncbi:MAG: TIGR02300 family protein [Xanthobacteraceae bacterium]|jgi:uncharacterized protein (TIGR02300 family)|nr:TIGR02300 family protein [Xanthobacteraceae bacterium]